MVILVNGSPREHGCTFTALSEVREELVRNGIDAKIVQAPEDKEEIKAIADEIRTADGLIVGSPVYYASLSGRLKVFLDEVFNRIGGSVRLKPASAIVSCRRGGASAAFDDINRFFSISEMLIVSSNYWNQVHGNTPEEVLKDEEGMQTMRILARNMAYVIKSIEKAGLPLPEAEAKIRTNFIR